MTMNKDEPRLTAPARVGLIEFGIGVPVSAVIQAAQEEAWVKHGHQEDPRDELIAQAKDALFYAWRGLNALLGNDKAKGNYISVWQAWDAIARRDRELLAEGLNDGPTDEEGTRRAAFLAQGAPIDYSQVEQDMLDLGLNPNDGSLKP